MSRYDDMENDELRHFAEQKLRDEIASLRAALAPVVEAYNALRPEVRDNLMRNVCADDTWAVLEVRHLRAAAEALDKGRAGCG